MGGVARELNLLQQASDPRPPKSEPGEPDQPDGPAGGGAAAAVPATAGHDDRCRELYRGLLELMDVTIRTDVLSGTSAGGINAALLGRARVTGADLGRLRDLWLETGSMDMLLRDPGEANPPSLMQGDKVLFSQLNRAMRELSGSAPEHRPSTTVFVTTTMMSGETSRFTDDYGTLVPDVDHHGLFTFDEEALGAGPDGPELTALALAARSSASFPGAFEPSYVPVNATVPAGRGIPERPDMADYANMTRSHWAADGGLLANRPLAPLLAKVLTQPATGQTRRVLAFVVPDGGGTPRAAAAPVPGDEWKNPLTMAAALKTDLDAQLSQSIASDLAAIRTHNERISTRHNLRRNLADLGSRLPAGRQPPDGAGPPSDGLITGRMLRDYECQQGAALAQPLVTELMRLLTTLQIPSGWASELAPGEQGPSGPAEPRLASRMMRILGHGWREAPPALASPAAPADGAAGETAAWGAWTRVLDPRERAAQFGLPVFLAAQAMAVHLIRLGYRRAATGEIRAQLAGCRKEIEDAGPGLTADWADGLREAGEVREDLRKAIATPPDGGLLAVATGLADRKRQRLRIGPGAEPGLRQSWDLLAAAVQKVLTGLQQLADSPAARASRAEAAGAIAVYLRYFRGATEPSQVADRLLKLALAERALLPADAELDQPVEFVQFSANTRTLLAQEDSSVPAAGQLDSVTKLRGVELHHFAAFYKSSWRAWDWMWGRLDGCGWLVHLLLDPARILAVTENRPDLFPPGRRAARFAEALREAVGVAAGLPGDALPTDLAFLDDHGAGIPVSLPNSALFLAQAWQNQIAASELPVVADRMVADGSRLPPLASPGYDRGRRASGVAGAFRWGWHVTAGRLAGGLRRRWQSRLTRRRRKKRLPDPPSPWATRVLGLQSSGAEPEDFARELPHCPVRQETLAGELRTPAFARLAAKAAAVATAAVAAAPEIPGAVRPVLASARSIARTGYQATRVTGGSGGKTMLAGVVLAVAGVLLATQGTLAVGLSGTIVALAGAYLIALGAWGLRRGLLTALLAFTAVALAAVITTPWMRTRLWATAPKGNSGVIPVHVLPWLQHNWWAGLSVVGGILVLAALLGMIFRHRPRRNRVATKPVVRR
jgi:patatin-related protein